MLQQEVSQCFRGIFVMRDSPINKVQHVAMNISFCRLQNFTATNLIDVASLLNGCLLLNLAEAASHLLRAGPSAWGAHVPFQIAVETPYH